jgi:transcriptional regulator with XRE-family HTH domain
MASISDTISTNLKRIRQERTMTLDDLAMLTGVSKSMLSDIERCNKSPTISVLEKICDGIGVPLSQLTHTESPQLSVVKNETMTHYSAWKGFEMFVLFGLDADRRFEIFRHEIQPHSIRECEPHDSGIREYLICTEGVLSVQVGDTTYDLSAGEAIQFVANCKHKYMNLTDQMTQMVMLLYHE